MQEIFQAVTENSYAADASLIAPLILVGRQHWTLASTGSRSLLSRTCPTRPPYPAKRSRPALTGICQFPPS